MKKVIRVSQISVPLAHTKEQILKKACALSQIPAKKVLDMQIIKQSVDARKKDALSYTYTVHLVVDEHQKVKKNPAHVQEVHPVKYQIPAKPENASDIKAAVIGAGPIGNLVAQTAKGMGAAKVMITDVSDLRLAKAKECGIDVCVNTKEKDFGDAMIEAFGPDKAEVIYDCAGNNITMGQAIKYARKGSVIVLVAVFAGMAEVDLAVANDHELDIKSTMMYRHDDYVDGIRLVNEGKVHLRPLISKTFAFKDYLKAYQYIDDNRETTMKVIINVQED